jgi:hypothetical protein
LRAARQHRGIAARDLGDQSIDIITGLQAATEIGAFGSQALRAWLFYRSQGLDVGWFALCEGAQFGSQVVLLGVQVAQLAPGYGQFSLARRPQICDLTLIKVALCNELLDKGTDDGFRVDLAGALVGIQLCQH